jgi:predicted AAA+ superfamily ATPase
MGKYIERIVDRELDELFGALPAIALEGARAVGKTETATRRARTVYRLDDEPQRVVAEADPRLVASGEKPILVDEWQRVPATWDVIRRAVDRDYGPGQFLLTGSASPTAPPTHSGAGRILTLRMRPLTLFERGVGEPTVSLRSLLEGARDPVDGSTEVTLADYVREIVASGFPALRPLPDRARRAQLDGYLRRIVDKDFGQQGLSPRRPATLRRWMTAYAAATSTTASLATIRDAAAGRQEEAPAKQTVQAYREILEQLWMLDPVPAWIPTRNYLSRLSRPPKHQMVDPALAARLLGVDADALLQGKEGGALIPRDGPLLGHLFEALATLSVRVFAQAAEARVRHLRLYSGAREVDLIVERPDHRVVAVEVKLSATVRDDDVNDLVWLRESIGDNLLDAVVINTGPRAYRRQDGIAVVPAALLGP